MSRKCAFERVKSLPDVFSLSTAMRVLDMDLPTLRVSLSRWVSSGMLQLAGPRAGIYYNLVVNPKSPGDNLSRVIATVYPEALLGESSVIHSVGWTTQIPQRIQVNVFSAKRYISLHGVELHPRPKSWFIQMQKSSATVSPEEAEALDFASYGLRSLKPEWALADMFTHEGCWRPDSDDLDVPDESLHAIADSFSVLSGVAIDQDVLDMDDLINTMNHYSKGKAR